MSSGNTPGAVRKPLIRLGAKPSDCWSWLGKRTPTGYPQKTSNGFDGSARRWLYTQLFGPLPDEFKITTTCDDVGCMNPHHWNVVTLCEALRAGAGSTLLPADVTEIRNARKGATRHTVRVYSERYGVEPGAIRAIWGDKTWRKVNPKGIEEFRDHLRSAARSRAASQDHSQAAA